MSKRGSEEARRTVTREDANKTDSEFLSGRTGKPSHILKKLGLFITD